MTKNLQIIIISNISSPQNPVLTHVISLVTIRPPSHLSSCHPQSLSSCTDLKNRSSFFTWLRCSPRPGGGGTAGGNFRCGCAFQEEKMARPSSKSPDFTIPWRIGYQRYPSNFNRPSHWRYHWDKYIGDMIGIEMPDWDLLGYLGSMIWRIIRTDRDWIGDTPLTTDHIDHIIVIVPVMMEITNKWRKKLCTIKLQPIGYIVTRGI